VKSRAAILVEQKKPLVIEEVELPALKLGQVLVKVLASGICGSQIGEINGVKGPDRFLPHLLGHEGCGEVLEAVEAALAHPHRRTLVFFDELNRCQESARNVLMPALDAVRRLFNPLENRFIAIPENVLFIAAVNRGATFTGTFGIDAAQLDRFAPLQLDYLPTKEEEKLLAGRHPELPPATIRKLVAIADRIRRSPDIDGGLSVRATDEVCTLLKHPAMEDDQARMLPELLRSSFCGRFAGRWDDAHSDAGGVWAIIEGALREEGVGK